MKTVTKIKTMALALVLVGMAVTGCKKDALTNEGPAGTEARPFYPNTAGGAVTINLTSSTPSPYGAVNIEIIGVVVHYVSTLDTKGYVTLPIRPRIYDLIPLKNKTIALTTKNLMPVGRLDQVRLILGQDNSYVVGDNIGKHFHHLFIPDQKYIVNVTVDAAVQLNQHTQITLDFNAYSSIVPLLKGQYFLLPDVTVATIP